MKMKSVFLVLALLSIIAPFAVAQEQFNCDSAIVDGANVLGRTGRADVEQALDSLKSLGFDVRVRTFKDIPAGSLNQFEEDQLLSRCASQWRTTITVKGKDKYVPRKNLILFLSGFRKADDGSVKKARGIFPGVGSTLTDDALNQIASNAGPYFTKEDFANGIVTSINGVHDVIVAQHRAKISGSGSAPAPRPIPTPDPGLKGISGLEIFFLIFAVVVIGIVLWRLLKTKKSEDAAVEDVRSGAQQRALIARQAAVSLLNSLNGNFDLFAAQAADQAKVRSVRARLDGVGDSLSNFHQTDVTNPETNSLGEHRYLAMADAYGNLEAERKVIQAAMNGDDEVSERPQVHPLAPSVPVPTPVHEASHATPQAAPVRHLEESRQSSHPGGHHHHGGGGGHSTMIIHEENTTFVPVPIFEPEPERDRDREEEFPTRRERGVEPEVVEEAAPASVTIEDDQPERRDPVEEEERRESASVAQEDPEPEERSEPEEEATIEPEVEEPTTQDDEPASTTQED